MNTIAATTVPAAFVNSNYADCNCGNTMHILTGQVSVTCSFCGGHFPIPELGYNESRLVESIWHHKEVTLCTVEDAPHW